MNNSSFKSINKVPFRKTSAKVPSPLKAFHIKVPSPFKRAIDFPCSIVIKPTTGCMFNHDNDGDDLDDHDDGKEDDHDEEYGCDDGGGPVR